MARSAAVVMVVALAVAACGPAPGPGRPAPAPGVLGLGDSVMLGASGALQAAIPGIEVDAVVSRQFREAPGIAYWRSQAGVLPGTVVVHLGTNGTVLPGTATSCMAVLGDRRVVFVDLTVPRSWEAGQQRDLAGLRGPRRRRVRRLARPISAGRADLLAPDGFHLNAAGAAAYAAAIAGSALSLSLRRPSAATSAASIWASMMARPPSQKPGSARSQPTMPAQLLRGHRAAGRQQLEVAGHEVRALLLVAPVDRQGEQLPVGVGVHVARRADEVRDVATTSCGSRR